MVRIKTLSPLICTAVLVLGTVAGCGGGSDKNEPNSDSSASTPSDGETSEAAPIADPPKTEVVTCQIEEGLPVAEVKVTNTTSSTGSFAITVQFLNGQTVLGEGAEFTSELATGQNETVRMGNMQGDAAAVDQCKVTDATLSE